MKLLFEGKMKHTCSLIFVLLALFFSENIFSQYDKELSSSTNNFAFRLYEKIIEKENSNIFFSPIGLSTAFAQVYFGSDNNTKSEIAVVFGFNDSLVAISDFYNNIFLSDTKKPNVLQNANSIWVNDNFELKPTYSQMLEEYFDSKIISMNVSESSECAEQINEWVKKTTESKIKEIVSEKDIDSLTVFILLNSLYFKDKWLNAFEKNNTVEDIFYLSRSETVKCQMMYTLGNFNYTQYQNYEALKIPYSSNKYSMLILLPKTIDGISEIEKNIDTLNVEKICNELKKCEVSLCLPKFKFEYDVPDLIALLKSLGIIEAFNIRKADFRGIIKDSYKLHPFMSEVVQKTFIEVNEEGTEAAATTMIKESYFYRGVRQDPKIFRVDHPFLFFIVEESSNCILFMGKCTNPVK